MKFYFSTIFLFAVTFSLSFNAHGNLALNSNTVKTNQQSKKQLRVKSSQQAAQMSKSRFGGKVLKVQKQKSGYRVKLIKTDGHIVSLYVDAKTGRISGGK
jgi:uncharacterized membrane protein YkoI